MSRESTPEPKAHGALARTTLHGVLWMTAGRFLKAPTNLLAVAILARLLTPADFGVVAIGFVVVALAAVLVDGTFGMVLVQRKTVEPDTIGASLLLSASLGGIFGLVLIVGGPIVQGYFDFPQLSQVLRVMATVLPISAVMAVTTGLLQRAHRFGVITINSFLAQVTYAAVAIALAFTGFGMWSLVWAQVVQVSVETVLGYLAVRPFYSIGFSVPALRESFRSGGMFTVSKIFNWAAGNVDTIVVGRLLGAAALGLYSRPRTLMHTINQAIGTGTARVLFSTFAKMQTDIPRMREAFHRALSSALVAAAFASAFMILFADLIVRVLLGPQWLSAVPILQALFAAFVTRSGYIVAEGVPLALGLGRASAYRQAAQFFLVITGAWAGSRFGVVGAAVGIAIAYWLFYLLCLVLVQQLLAVGYWRLLKTHLKLLPLVAAPVLVTLAARHFLQPGGSIPIEVGLAALYGLVSALVLSFAPASLLSQDIGRFRTYLFGVASSRVRTLAGAR